MPSQPAGPRSCISATRCFPLSFDFEPSVDDPSPVRAVTWSSLSPFLATLTRPRQLTEKAGTLSPAFATLTRRVKHKPFVCHSYRKHRGGGIPSLTLADKVRFPVSCLPLLNPLTIHTPENTSVTPVEATLTKTGGVGSLQPSLRPLRVRTPMRAVEGEPFIQASHIGTERMDPARNHWYIAWHTEGLTRAYSPAPAVRACSFEVPSFRLPHQSKKESEQTCSRD